MILMNIHDKLKKRRKDGFWKLSEEEKTGVINGLVLLGAVAGTLSAMHHEAHAQPTCDDGVITNTNIISQDFGIDDIEWGNHCWWDHAWRDYDDHSNVSP